MLFVNQRTHRKCEPEETLRGSCRLWRPGLIGLPGLLAAVLAAPASGHGGALAADGCHRDHSTGERHCHGPGREAERRAAAPGYRREDWHRRWLDADRDCLNTRHEVLLRQSLGPVRIADCKVVAGRWRDPYTGRIFTNPAELDIDHLVPLAEAHRSGGAAWTAGAKQRYANDLNLPQALIAVSASANRSKSDRDPASWLPPDPNYRCQYVRDWQLVKQRHGLSMDAREAATIRSVERGCRGR